ncbi:hypothetical protein QJS04_geneDACA017367 [Acorus gramineus]|uniref:Uncharacterized protein n=1 Tax=Acorus gramineus TaxID=55184 RepID=A0AAV9B7P8_ACOGR|nr:hypothetical protein QJS04_geneDACA017367 [Acorus gramineus]
MKIAIQAIVEYGYINFLSPEKIVGFSSTRMLFFMGMVIRLFYLMTYAELAAMWRCQTGSDVLHNNEGFQRYLKTA